MLSSKSIVTVGAFGFALSLAVAPWAVHGDTVTSDTALSLAVNPVISSYSTGPTVTLGAITPDTTGKQSTAADTVSANTNDTAGLTISLQEKSAASTAMIAGANTITTSSGTPAAPAALTNNNWGWRVDSLAGFGAGPSGTLANAVPSALTYAGIPVNGSPFVIKTTSAVGSSSTSVWYSARINNTQPLGTYATTVTYTIVTN